MDSTLRRRAASASTMKTKIKRPCCSSSTDFNRAPNANPMHETLESFLQFSDVSTTVPALELSFERIIESANCDCEKDNVIERALRLGSALIEVAQRANSKLASLHNASVWGLPSDLTIKVFSMIDTQSLCYASATCSFFHKCAADPLCYSYIDLTTTLPKVDNLVVSTMIQRAGKALRSLMLGYLPSPHVGSLGSSRAEVYSMTNSADCSGFSLTDGTSRQGKSSKLLSRSCLSPLTAVNGFAPGALLRRLHLYNIDRMDNNAVESALSACPSLLDLEIVGMNLGLKQTLKSVSRFCHSIERLFIEASKLGGVNSLKLRTCTTLVNNCPDLSSLSLRGYKLHDIEIVELLKGFHRLKYIDFSKSFKITGDFLKSLEGTVGGSLLEVIILRDCMHLRNGQVSRLLSAIHAGGFKHLRHLDISNKAGLAAGDGHHPTYSLCARVSPSYHLLVELLEDRPHLRVVADFPPQASYDEDEPMICSNSWDTSDSFTTDDTMTNPSDHSNISDHTGDIQDDISESDYMDYPW